MPLITLGIETSCDETGMALLAGERQVLANVLYSQVPLHRRFGGVVPEIASRKHLVKLTPLLRNALARGGCSLDDVGLIAVTRGPGLIGPLLVGLCFAKALAMARGIPIIGVNHLEGHLFSAYFGGKQDASFLGLIVSGGHTELVSVSRARRLRLLAAQPGLGRLSRLYRCFGLRYRLRRVRRRRRRSMRRLRPELTSALRRARRAATAGG
jgi:N6-L-threonylcarbamoyladenine synthase